MTNKFLKFLGVIGMLVSGVCSCFFGFTTIYNWNNMDTDDYFDTAQCIDYMYTEIYNVVSIYNEYYRDDSLDIEEIIENNVSNNTNVMMEEYDSSSNQWETVIEVEHHGNENTGKTIKVYIVKNSVNNFYITDKATFDALQEGEDGYRFSLSIAGDIQPDDTYYTSYVLYNVTRPYSEHSVVYTVISLIVLLALTIYEVSAAGHQKGEEDIHLTWWDKIPFDIMTIITVIICYLVGTLEIWSIETFVQSAYGSSFIEMFIVPQVILIFFMCMIFIWLLSFAVRIKAHTLLRNNALSGTVIWLFCKLKKGIEKLMIYYHESTRVWKFISILSIIAFMITTFILFSFSSYFASIYILFVLFLLIFEIIGLVSFIKISHDTQPLLNQAKQLSSGDLQCRISQEKINRMHGPFHEHAQNLNKISEGMEKAIQNELKSERMKAELITNVSHDIKTPLTSIINYVDLLSKEHTEEEEKQYIEILQRQSQRLKRLTEDVVEASKASAGTLQVHFETVNIKELLDQSLAEYQDKFEANDLQLITIIPNESIKVNADGRLVWRVYRNLLSNISKYALSGSRVYIEVRENGNGQVVTTFKNISRDPLNISEEELMERFVRGDASRHTEGSGLGLSIARSLTELMHGSFQISIDADLFKAEVILEGIHE